MKLVASNIFDFTSWYKFGYRFVPIELIIDISHNYISGEELLNKTGFFEEDYEVFFLELSENINGEISNLMQISLHDVVRIIPITEKGGKLLSTKIPDFSISQPISSELSGRLFEARNFHLAISGGRRLFASFNQFIDENIIQYQNAFLNSLSKYFSDLDAEQDTVLDNILFYERSKPYPLTDVGFLFDIGGLARTRFHLTDDDFKNRDQLKIDHPDKFDLVEEVFSLSKFIQSKSTERIWTEFINEYSTNENLKKLSVDLSIVPGTSEINNILVLAFYLKFRYLIRNSTNLEDKHFTSVIAQFLQNAPTESRVALYLVGMFFGALKFKELYYKNVPLKISRYKFQPPVQPPMQTERISFNEKIKVNDAEDQVNEQLSHSGSDVLKSFAQADAKVLDEMFWDIMEDRLSKLSKAQQKLIKSCYLAVVNFKGELFTSRTDYMINMLKKKMKNSKAEKPVLTPAVIAEVQTILNEYFPPKN